MSINRDTKILEAILFASGSPVLEDDLKDKIINKKDFKLEMENLKEFYKDRGINLIKTGNKWSFRTEHMKHRSYPNKKIVLIRL